jgi:hypothetical protein
MPLTIDNLVRLADAGQEQGDLSRADLAVHRLVLPGRFAREVGQ